jgi:hypothetical protein
MEADPQITKCLASRLNIHYKVYMDEVKLIKLTKTQFNQNCKEATKVDEN